MRVGFVGRSVGHGRGSGTGVDGGLRWCHGIMQGGWRQRCTIGRARAASRREKLRKKSSDAKAARDSARWQRHAPSRTGWWRSEDIVRARVAKRGAGSRVKCTVCVIAESHGGSGANGRSPASALGRRVRAGGATHQRDGDGRCPTQHRRAATKERPQTKA